MKILVVFASCFLIAEGFSFATDYNVTRLKRQSSKCSSIEKECGSGECISGDNVCDGKEDCKDGSDETISCMNNYCPAYLFRCAYGACINSDNKCDGKSDCRDNSDEAPSICKKEVDKAGSCDKDQYQCKDGQCIDDADQCDGISNCADGSDETVENCGSVRCPPFSFKCAYGACINSELRCNGVNNCVDNSDEAGCGGLPVTTSTPPIIVPTPSTPPKVPKGGQCILPPQPQHGKWMVNQPSMQPGDIAEESTLLTFSCNTNYSPMARFSLCIQGKWTATPKCIKTCPKLPERKHLIVTCSLDGARVDCDPPFEGTKATVKCEDLYDDPSIETRPYRFCHDGSWDYSLPNCEPVCGLKSVDAQKLVINGKNATKGEFPWHVGIYQSYDYICGGSIISPKLILTAAHCFESMATEVYLVAAGKYYRQYNDTRDDQAQFSKINELIIHEDYHGGMPFEAYDLAVLVLANPFKMTKYVLPVCLDVIHFDLSELISQVGIVIGWGWTQETGAPSEILKYLEVEYKTKQTCTLPKDFTQYYIPYAPDKLCAGFRNQGKSACRGDSGGGLVFPNNKGKYFVRGIVSVAPRKGSGCDSNQFSLFTSVNAHISFIEQLKSKYRV